MIQTKSQHYNYKTKKLQHVSIIVYPDTKIQKKVNKSTTHFRDYEKKYLFFPFVHSAVLQFRHKKICFILTLARVPERKICVHASYPNLPPMLVGGESHAAAAAALWWGLSGECAAGLLVGSAPTAAFCAVFTVSRLDGWLDVNAECSSCAVLGDFRGDSDPELLKSWPDFWGDAGDRLLEDGFCVAPLLLLWEDCWAEFNSFSKYSGTTYLLGCGFWRLRWYAKNIQ